MTDRMARLSHRAATIDELLSDSFTIQQTQKSDIELAVRRLGAWCRAASSGDWTLFSRRLRRDRRDYESVLCKFSSVRRNTSAPVPAWVDNATWIEAALQRATECTAPTPHGDTACAFEDLIAPVAQDATILLWKRIDPKIAGDYAGTARASFVASLVKDLSNLCAQALYERFAHMRRTQASASELDADGGPDRTAHYRRFATSMRAGGFTQLFDEKPVLLRLMSSLVRQWIDTTQEFIVRLHADRAAIQDNFFHSSASTPVIRVDTNLSDPHNGGRSVKVVTFENGEKVVYKPKDSAVDVAWFALIDRLNDSAPLTLRAPRAIARSGYGWTEFVAHTATTPAGCTRFFRRAGAWVALFHSFVATDMHQENVIAAGDHPVPIDLEMILQAGSGRLNAVAPEDAASLAAEDLLANSVMMVGLIPSYGRAHDNNVFAVGGMTANWISRTELRWRDVNTDAMRPDTAIGSETINPNLPHVDGAYARFADHIDSFVSGFEEYANFLLSLSRAPNQGGLLDAFSGLPVRKVVRPTRFYQMLLQRLRNHRTMEDGAVWSAQADFIARLADWQVDADPMWPLQRAERSALTSLNVPHFFMRSNGNAICDATGLSVRTEAPSGLSRARARLQNLSESEIAWQITVIRENTNSAAAAKPPAAPHEQPSARREAGTNAPCLETFRAEADRIAHDLSARAVRRGVSAAWIGLDWLGDAEVFQLARLGPDLYNGTAGIALFLAAHSAVCRSPSSAELALAGLAHIRKALKTANAARTARSMGVGGATGMGSLVYALAVISTLLGDDALAADAHTAAALITDDLIAADRQLDVVSGSAGAILGLLRLYRDSQSRDVLMRAAACGEHLMRQSRIGPDGRRTWVGQGFGTRGLNGMSHGAAGFAYALASLAAATGNDTFAQAAAECIAHEDATYDEQRQNWPDLRSKDGPSWPCQWCHGAPGIGLARIASLKFGGAASEIIATDVGRAVAGAKQGWAAAVDTLCCGALGQVEFLCEAAGALGRDNLATMARQRLAAVVAQARDQGDYLWNTRGSRFNVGFFRGLAGVGYTLLRHSGGSSLPNVLIWE